MPFNLGAPIVPTGNANTYTEASIDFSSTGDNTVVSAVAGKTVRVYRIFFVCSATTSVKFKDGAGTDLTGAMSMSANGGFTLDAINNEPWFTTSAGNAFIVNQSGSAQISGRIYYSQ